jgi:DNA-binding response OmpR family regulator
MDEIANIKGTLPGSPALHRTALVVDDHPYDVSYIKKELIHHGFQVIEATDVETAIHKAKGLAIDVLIIELFLKQGDGAIFTRSIRWGEINNIRPDILIFGCSNKQDSKLKNLCREADIDVFFYKPLDVYLLLDCIRSKERASALACQSDSVEAGSNKRIYTT